MSLKRKVKKFLKKTIGDFTGLQWRDLDHKKVYLAIAGLAALLALIIVLVVCLVAGGKKENQDSEGNPDKIVTEEVQSGTSEENPL